LSFEANLGQSDPQVKFLSHGAGQSLFLTATEAVFVFGGLQGENLASAAAIRMKLLGANNEAEVTGVDRLPGSSNYFIGNDPAKWRTQVPFYAKVLYSGIYRGIDLVYYGNQRELEYDFVIAPGADPKQIRIGVQGATRAFVDNNGDVVMRNQGRDVRMRAPRLYQRMNGRLREVAGRYRLRGREVGFEVGTFDRSQPLIIDPVLSYSTYLGGSAGDEVDAIAVDSSGNAYITGFTNSTDFPGIGATSFQSSPSHFFVAKLNPTGTAILYATYLGSSGVDQVQGIAVDSSGDAYVAGYTNGTNFPTTASAFQLQNRGGYDAFVTKLNPTGNGLLYSTYLGGSQDDSGKAIALDAAGDAYITGLTNSPDFYAGLSPIQSQNHSLDAFVAELSPTGSALYYSTYLGGSGYDEGDGIAVDSQGNAYVTGRTNSTDFPGMSASSIQAANAGLYEAFLTKINASGTAIVYSTYLGGSNYDYGYGVAVDSGGDAYVTGFTSSTAFTGVTSSSLQPTNGAPTGSGTVYVAKVNPAGTALAYSTFLGGNGGDNGTSIAVDVAGDAWVTGNTYSANFPGVNASSIQSSPGKSPDAFVAELNPAGSALLYATYLGGSSSDSGKGIAVDAAGDVYVGGSTQSPDFPLGSALQSALRGVSDGFVVKLSASGAAATNTVLTSSPNPSGFGQTVTLAATVSILGGSGTPTGTITFKDGSTVLGTEAPGNPVTVSSLSVGSHMLTAAYSGDSNFAASTSAVVQQVVKQYSSTITLNSSSSSSGFGQSVTFTATVGATSALAPLPTGSVIFLDGTEALGTVTLAGTASAVASLSTSALTAGLHSITATYGGDGNFAGSVSPVLGQNVAWPGTFTGPPFLTTISVGNGPAAMALNPVTNRIYVADRLSNDVAVIDAGTYAVITKIPVGQGPRAIAVNTQTNIVYTADFDSSTVTMIDGAANSAIKTVSLIELSLGASIPFGPVALTVDEPNNQVFVGSGGSPFAIMDGAGANVNFFNYLGGPIAFANSPFTDRTYVAFSQDSDIAAFEGATQTRLADFDSGFISPVALAADPAAGTILAADTTGTLDTIDEVTGTFTRQSLGSTPASLPATVPGTPYQVLVQGFVGDLGVTYASTGTALTRAVFGAALSQGQYSVTAGGLYTFAVADSGTAIVISYNIVALPYSVAVDARDQRVYLANQSGVAGQPATVAVSNAGPGGAFKSVPVGTTKVPVDLPAPSRIAVDEGSDLVYVANDASNDVSIIDGQTVWLITSVPVGVAPTALVRDPFSCDVFAANFGSSTVTVISRVSGGGPLVCLSQASVAFGPQAVGTTSPTQTVTLTNIGGADLQVTGVVRQGDFTVQGDCAPVPPSTVKIVAAGQRCSLLIAFAPTAQGLRKGSVAINSNAAGSPQTIMLSGAGTVPSQVQLTANPNALVYGQAPSFTATVSAAAGGSSVVPTGTVSFIGDGCFYKPCQDVVHSLGTQVLQSGGATLNPGSPYLLSIGNHTFSGVYHGDMNFAGGSGTVSVTVSKGATSVSVYNSGADLLIAVYPQNPAGGVPTGVVTVRENQATVATAVLSNGEANVSASSSLAGGTHKLTAIYSGDSNFLGSTSPPVTVVVPAPTVTALQSSSSSSTFKQPVTFSAKVTATPTSAGTPAGNVIFRDGPTQLGTGVVSASGAATLTTSTLTIGKHSITAEYLASGVFLGSKSPPLKQVVNSASGGTASDECTTTVPQNYVNPTAGVDPGSDPLTSPGGKYAVVASIDNGAQQTSLQVTLAASGAIVKDFGSSPITTHWGFSPDGERFVYHYLMPGSDVDQVYVYDLSVQPPRKLVDYSTAQAGTRLQFSPSGAYFRYSYLVPDPAGTSHTTDLQIYRIQGVSMQDLVYDSGFLNFSTGSGDEFGEASPPSGAAGWGFSPDSPETSFVYAYLDSGNTFQWNLVNLASGRLVNTQTETTIASFWQFNQWGTVIALVTQPSPSQAQIDLFDTSTGAALHGSATVIPSLQLTLFSVGGYEKVQYPGTTQTLVQDPGCIANTPTGAKVTVEPRDPDLAISPVNITFSNVTTAGVTSLAMSSSGPAPQKGFKLGDPPTYYELSTTAQFSGAITVCINYSGISYTNASAIKFYHYENGQWVDHTISNDTVHHIACGQVFSFSPFALFEGSDTTPPVVTATLSPAANGAGWNNSDDAVTLSATDDEPGGSGVSQISYSIAGAQTVALTNVSGSSASFTISAQGTSTVTFYATDGAGNVSNPASLTVNIDKTPPVIVPAISGPSGKNGWYTGPVTISWNVTDPESGIATATGCGMRTLTADTAGVTVTCSANNNAGLATSVPVTVKIDQTPPALACASSPAANVNGWNNTDVTVAFTAADVVSGLASVSPSITLTTEGASQVVNGTATNNAGISSVVACNVSIDKTPPEAFSQFDPVTKDVLLFGKDSLSGVPAGPVKPAITPAKSGGRNGKEHEDDDQGSGGGEVRTYQISDLAGNVLSLVEDVRKQEEGLSAHIVSLQYGTAGTPAGPVNSEDYEWDNEGGQLGEFHQTVTIGTGRDRLQVRAELKQEDGQTQTVIDVHGQQGEQHVTMPGMILLRTVTNNGKLAAEY
jgi:YVTN family beta-propeller protein